MEKLNHNHEFITFLIGWLGFVTCELLHGIVGCSSGPHRVIKQQYFISFLHLLPYYSLHHL